MATTFRDFIVECELYPYSRENFEFMKECSELELTEKFINDQIFVTEAYENLRNTKIELEENYFQESVDTSSLEVLTEKFNNKKNSLVKRMMLKIFKIFNVFSKFFGKIGNKFDATTKKGQEVLSMLNKTTLDEIKVGEIRKIVNNAKSNNSTAFPVKMNQPFRKHVKFKYGGHDKNIEQLRDDIAVALSDDKVVAEALINNSNDNLDMERIGIMDPDEIYKAGIILCTGKESDIITIAKNFANSWVHVKKNGLVIDVNTNNINKTAENLTNLCDKINKIASNLSAEIENSYDSTKKTIVTAASVVSTSVASKNDNTDTNNSDTNNSGGILQVLGNLDSSLPKGSEIAKSVNNAITMLTSTIGLTTKVYTQLNAYRQTVITSLDDYLKNNK